MFVDGAFVPELSDLAALEPGLKSARSPTRSAAATGDIVARLGAPGPAEGDVAYALNTAFMGDGAVIEVAAGAQIARPLHLVFAYGSRTRCGGVFALPGGPRRRAPA